MPVHHDPRRLDVSPASAFNTNSPPMGSQHEHHMRSMKRSVMLALLMITTARVARGLGRHSSRLLRRRLT
jgi:hypothetical protein